MNMHLNAYTIVYEQQKFFNEFLIMLNADNLATLSTDAHPRAKAMFSSTAFPVGGL